MRTSPRDCMKTPDRSRTSAPPSAENGPTGLYFGVWCCSKPTSGPTPTTFHTVSPRTPLNKGAGAVKPRCMLSRRREEGPRPSSRGRRTSDPLPPAWVAWSSRNFLGRTLPTNRRPATDGRVSARGRLRRHGVLALCHPTTLGSFWFRERCYPSTKLLGTVVHSGVR
jgi:hypothetical protein